MVKNPQGFSIIFTTSNTNGLIGNKGSGIGYDGINNAVVFEFDFIQNSEKNDPKFPHFSAHYNLNGPVSSISNNLCIKDGICNVKLDNFYDNEKSNYIKNLKIYIEIVGGILKVYSSKNIIVKDKKFPHLDNLFEKGNVYF